jgi:hypothetical protein
VRIAPEHQDTMPGNSGAMRVYNDWITVRNTALAEDKAREKGSIPVRKVPEPGWVKPPPFYAEWALGRLLRHITGIHSKSFDYSYPVDEYAPTGNPGAINMIQALPDYQMPERITTIMVIIPVGTTYAQLQIGPRTWQLYSGTALSTPLILPMPVHGIILNEDDPRILTLTGTIGSQPYLGLTGFALSKGQYS